MVKHSRKSDLVGMVVAGGLENAGGIGRVIGYVLDRWQQVDFSYRVQLIDPRGGGSVALFPLFLLRSFVEIFWLKITGKLGALHINLSFKASTFRKFFIVVWARLLNIPCILHLHGSKFDIFYRSLSPKLQKSVLWMFEKAEKTIVLGENWKRFLIDEVGVSPEKIVVIPNGVPALTLPRQKNEVPHIVFLGRLGARKGVPELLGALASSDMRNLDWRATLAGDGDVEFYQAEAKKLQIDSRISFPGWVDGKKVQEILASGDILVLPSHAEGLPISVLEALSGGLAVVTTPVGSLPELLTDQVDSLIVPVGDSDKLARALKTLVENKEIREGIGYAGLQLFKHKLDISITANAIESVYDGIIKKQG